MKKILLYGFVFIIVFGGSAASSWFVFQPAKAPALSEQEIAPDQALAPPQLDSLDATRLENLPAMWRPTDMTADAILKMADSLKKREEAIKENESRLQQERSRMEFVFQDLYRERTELESLHDKVSARIDEAQTLLKNIQTDQAKLNEKRAAVEQELNEHKADLTKFSQSELANVKKLAEYYQGMDELTAARYMREMCDNGKIELAASILDSLEKREATKILVALDDPVLVSQIMEKIKERPANTTGDNRKGNTRR
jgi:flagellar motility protein MotE (MotC chaperone)